MWDATDNLWYDYIQEITNPFRKFAPCSKLACNESSYEYSYRTTVQVMNGIIILRR